MLKWIFKKQREAPNSVIRVWLKMQDKNFFSVSAKMNSSLDFKLTTTCWCKFMQVVFCCCCFLAQFFFCLYKSRSVSMWIVLKPAQSWDFPLSLPLSVSHTPVKWLCQHWNRSPQSPLFMCCETHYHHRLHILTATLTFSGALAWW